MKVDHEEAAKAWESLAEKMLSLGERILDEAATGIPRKSSDPKAVCLMLLARSITNVKGTLLLVRSGLIIEARILVRACLENAFWVVALNEEGDGFVQKMADHDLNHRSALGERVLEFQAKRGSALNDGLRSMIRMIKKINPKTGTLNPKGVAERGSFRDFYITYQKLSADSAHPTTETLSRYLGQKDKNGERAVEAQPTPAPVEEAETLWFLCISLMSVCVGVNQILGGTKAGQGFGLLEQEYQEYYRGYVSPPKTGT